MRAIVFFVLACLFVMLSGCGSLEETVPTSSIESRGKGTILIRIVSPDRDGRLGKIVAIDRITAFFLNPDATELPPPTNLIREGDRAKATISVDPGNWTVTINSYEGDLIVKTGSDPDVDVGAGETTTVDIAPSLFIPTLDIERGTTGTYTVKWGKVFSADTYTLQEDDNSAFSTPEMVYTGSDTAKSFTGKTAGASYYYRVCATMNDYDGNSKWSVWAAASVLGDGTIEIDIPWDVWDEETDRSGSTVSQFTEDHPALEIYGELNITQLGSNLRIMGEVINKGTTTIGIHHIYITVLDRDGTILGYNKGYISSEVASGGIKPFTVDVPNVSLDQVGGGRVSFLTYGEEGTEGANPVLSVVSPLAVVYQYSYVDATATVTGEVENSGSIDAHNVVLQLTARNASGTAMDQASKTIGDVPAGSKVFFSLTFTQRAFSSAEHPMSYCDYSISYDEGGPDTGTVEVK